MNQTKRLGASLLAALLIILALHSSAVYAQYCPEGCACISESNAVDQFGKGNYQLCSQEPCDKEQTATGNFVNKYCFKGLCPQGCTCMTDVMAKEKRYSPCSNQRISCGYDQKQNPMFCFSPTTETACPSGCQCLTEAQAKQMGYSALCQNQRINCGKDVYGYPKYCFQSPSYSCPTGCICLSKEEALAKKISELCLDSARNPIVCGSVEGISKYCFKQPAAPQQCRYDYSIGKCIGDCRSGTNCQLNTIYRDSKTGKVTYAECHCK